MPRVYLDENRRLSVRLVAWIYGELKVQKISQRAIASELGISQSAFAQKLKNYNFTFLDFLTIIRVLNPDQNELNRLLGR